MNINANTGQLGVAKPHLYFNKVQKHWTCFHWGRGYIPGETMRGAYLKWRELSGLIDKAGEESGGKGGGNSSSTTYIYSSSFL